MLEAGTAAAWAWALLAAQPGRWAHTRGVARLAADIAARIPDLDGDVLLAAAWVHDIGYAPNLAATGFHHLDGAAALAARGELELASIVAHHTSGDAEADARGLTRKLQSFAAPSELMAAAVAYCHLHAGPGGVPTGVDSRIAEVEVRYGPGHPVTRGLRAALPGLRDRVELIEALLRQSKTGWLSPLR